MVAKIPVKTGGRTGSTMRRLKRKLHFDEAKKEVIYILLKHKVIKQRIIEKLTASKKQNFELKRKK